MENVGIRRAFGIKDDSVTGGSEYDDLTSGIVPDSDTWWPVTTANADFAIQNIDRNAEVRGRRAGVAPLPFRASPSMTLSVPCLRNVAEKIIKKAWGGTDTVSGGGPYTHTIAALGFGQTSLPAVHAQLIRDALNHKMSGGQFNSVTFNFPLDGQATIDAEVQGLFMENYQTAQPTVSFSGESEDIMMLRDAWVSVDSGSNADEVQTITITGTPTGGTFKLTFNGATTSNIAYNANASAVDTALEALPSIGAGNVTVSGGPGPGTPYVVTFAGALTNRDVPMIGVEHSFTGGTNPSISIAETTKGRGTNRIRDLQGFSLTWTNNLGDPRWYANRNIVTKTLGYSTQQTKKLWYPSERRLGAMQSCAFRLDFGSVDADTEFALNYAQIRKIVFEVVGAQIAGGTEILRFTLYNAVLGSGGPDALSARDDISSSYEGGAFYSTSDSNDVLVEIVGPSNTPIT